MLLIILMRQHPTDVLIIHAPTSNLQNSDDNQFRSIGGCHGQKKQKVNLA